MVFGVVNHFFAFVLFFSVQTVDINEFQAYCKLATINCITQLFFSGVHLQKSSDFIRPNKKLCEIASIENRKAINSNKSKCVVNQTSCRISMRIGLEGGPYADLRMLHD